MPRECINITNNVIDKIETNQVSMIDKNYKLVPSQLKFTIMSFNNKIARYTRIFLYYFTIINTVRSQYPGVFQF